MKWHAVGYPKLLSVSFPICQEKRERGMTSVLVEDEVKISSLINSIHEKVRCDNKTKKTEDRKKKY